MLQRSLPDRQTQVRFLRFFLVGGCGFLVQLGSLAVLKECLPARLAFSLAYILSVATHYLLNRFWALPSRRSDPGRQFLEYVGTIGLSYLISFGCFNLFYGWCHLSVMWATVWSVPPSTLAVFFLLNYRVFKSA
jgi:putative flippase GtrA